MSQETTIEQINIEITASSSSAERGLASLEAALGRVRNVAKGGIGLTTVTNQLAKLNATVQASPSYTALNKLAEGLKALNAVEAPKLNIRTVANQLERLREVMPGINAMDMTSVETKLGELATGLNKLKDIEKNNLGSVVTQLSKISSITEQLDDETLKNFAKACQETAIAVKPLATEMEKVSNGFNALPTKIKRVISQLDSMSSSTARAWKEQNLLDKILSDARIKFAAYAAVFKRLWNVLGNFVSESNNYVEDMNLFNVTMGEGAKAASAYAYEVQNALSIDAADFMKNQGIFQQIVSAFGTVSSQATVMSKNLTQLGYDISSFFNISVDDAMLKLQSGIAGEMEPLRRLGYALDSATLQQVAYRNGIEKNISSMTQAEKSQLRYIAIMEQSKNVMGDMARTINSPANAMRVLSQQITMLKRALGNILIPVLLEILPYVIAFTKVLTQAAQALAKLVGYEFPTFDYSSVANVGIEAETAADKIGDIGGAAKKAGKQIRKDLLLTFDELNVLSDKDSGGSGSGGAAVGGLSGVDSLIDELPSYDFLGGLDGVNEKVEEITKSIKRFIPLIKTLATVLGVTLAAKGVVKAINKFEDLRDLLGGKKGISGIMGKVATGVLGFAASFASSATLMYSFTLSGNRLLGVLSSLVVGIGAVGAVLSGLLGPVGWVIAAVGTLTGVIVGYRLAQEQLYSETVDNAFHTRVFDNGGVLVSEYCDQIARAIEQVSAFSARTAEYCNQITQLDDTILNSYNTVLTYSTAWEATGTITKEQIGTMIASLDQMLQATQEKITFSASIFRETLTNAIRTSTGAAQENYKSILNIAYLLESNMNTRVAECKAELAAATLELNNLDESSATYNEDAARLMTKIGDLNNEIYGLSDSSWTAKNEVEALANSYANMDFSSFVDGSNLAQDALSNLDETTATAYQNTTDTYHQMQKDMETMFSQVEMDSPQWKQIVAEATKIDPTLVEGDVEGVKRVMREQLEQMYQGQIADIDALYLQAKGTIMGSINDAMGDSAAEVAKQKVGELKDAFSKEYGYEDFAQLCASGNTAVITQVTEEAMGFYDQEYKKAYDKIIANNKDMLGELDTAFGNMDNARALAIDAGSGVAQTLVQGVGEGLTDSSAQSFMNNGFEHLASYMQMAANRANEAGSPARIMIEPGEYVTWGVVEGMTDDTSMRRIDDAAKEVSKALLTSIENVIEKSAKNSGTSSVAIATALTDSIKKSLDNKMKASAFTKYGKDMMDGVKQGVLNGKSGYAETITKLMNDGKELVSNNKQKYESAMKDIVQKLAHTVTIDKTVENAIRTMLTKTSSVIRNDSSIKDAFKTMFGGSTSGFDNLFKELANKVRGDNSLTSAFEKVFNKVLSKTDSWTGKMRTAVNDMLGNWSKSMNSVSFNSQGKMSFTPMGRVSIPRFEQGGYPSTGQLFIAREAGAEMVGSIGNKTAVANNDQIVEAVALGVYQAVKSAQEGEAKEINANITVTLDGETVYRNQQQIAAQKGYDFGMRGFANV